MGDEDEEAGAVEVDNLKLRVLLPLSFLTRGEGVPLIWFAGDVVDFERGEEGEAGEKGDEVLRESRLRCRGVVLGVAGE